MKAIIHLFFPLILICFQTPARKVYSIDVGLSNSVGFGFSENKGRLIENVVLVELLRRKIGSEVYYWKNGDREVDFVLKDELNVEQLIAII